MVAPNGAAAISRGVYPVDQITPRRKKPQQGAGDGSDGCLRTFGAPRSDTTSIPVPRHGANRLRTFGADDERFYPDAIRDDSATTAYQVTTADQVI
jgi:hypothetical protein